MLRQMFETFIGINILSRPLDTGVGVKFSNQKSVVGGQKNSSNEYPKKIFNP